MEYDDKDFYEINSTPFLSDDTQNSMSEEDWEERREIERRRAAARRRKIEARQRRRRKRMIQAIIRCSILLLIVILLLVGIIKMITGVWKHFHKYKKPDKTTEQVVNTESTEAPAPKIDENILAKELPSDRDAALAIIKKLAKTDSDMASIYDNAAVYQDKVLKSLAVNPEMTEFVLNYPAKINIVFDGEFSVEVPEKKVPLFLQYDEKWGYADYGNELIATTGSGPVCLSMACVYLQKNGKMNPIKVADYAVSKGYLKEDGTTDWKLMTDGAEGLELTSAEVPLDKKKMQEVLKEGKLLICSMKPGDFTKDSSYILIYKCKDGLFYLNDPSSAARSDVPWTYKRLSSQIGGMWAIGK